MFQRESTSIHLINYYRLTQQISPKYEEEDNVNEIQAAIANNQQLKK